MRLLSFLLLAAGPALLGAQTVVPARDSVRLVIGQVDTSRAVLRGASGALAYTGTNATAFTAHRDGRLTALSVGCGYQRISFGEWSRAQVRVCVVAAPPTPIPIPPTPGPTPAPLPSPTPALRFRSDFPVAGTTLDGLMHGAWRSAISSIQGLAVVPSTGLDFPMPNVLRVTALLSRSGYSLLRTDTLGEVPVGGSRYYRVYVRYVFPDSLADNQSHPIQDGNAGSQINWAWSIRHNQGGPGRFTAGMKLHTNNVWDHAEWTPPPLRKHTTYRFEHQVERVSVTHFRLHVRIYTSDDVLLYDDDFVGNQGVTRLAGQMLLFNNPTALGGLNAGLNGISGLASDWVYSYQGGFAVSDRGWIGAWRQP